MQDYIERSMDINAKMDNIVVKQFDNDSRYLHVTITDYDLPDGNDKKFNLTGCTAALYIQPNFGYPSSENVAYVAGEIADGEDGIVSFLLPGSVTQNIGDYKCEIWLTNGGGAILSSKPFIMKVEESIRSTNAIEASSQYSALDAKIIMIDRIEDDFDELKSRLPTLADTVSDININQVTVGQVVMTRGFYSVDDGGSSTYIVTDSEPDVPWFVKKNGADVYLGIQKKTSYSALELGFKAEAGFDNAAVFNALHPSKCEMVFPDGKFEFSPIHITKTNHFFSFKGIDSKNSIFTSQYYAGSQTVFVPHSENQTYIMKIGGLASDTELTNPDNSNPYQGNYFSGFKIQDIAFSDDGKPVTEYMMEIEYCALISGNLAFRNSTSKALSFRNTWEHYWDYIIIRSVSIPPMFEDADGANDNEHPYSGWKINACWDIRKADTAHGGNCSAITVGLLDVERVASTVLCARTGSNMDSCTIDKVQIEGTLPDRISGTVFAATAADVSSGISTYTDPSMRKLPLFAFNDTSGLIINSVSLQNVGYKYFASGNHNYVQSLLYGYGNVYIGSVVQSTTFHLFMLSNSKTTAPTARQFTIGSYVADKFAMMPAITSGYDHIYRVYTSPGTTVLHSTVQIYKNGVGLETPKTIDFIQSSSGSDTYCPANPSNTRHYPCVRFHGSGLKKIVPKQFGACDTVKIVMQTSNANVIVNRYKAGLLLNESSSDISFGTSVSDLRLQTLVLPAADYDSYEIVYNGSGSNSYVEICSLTVE